MIAKMIFRSSSVDEITASGESTQKMAQNGLQIETATLPDMAQKISMESL
jgi:hypothetical protein